MVTAVLVVETMKLHACSLLPGVLDFKQERAAVIIMHSLSITTRLTSMQLAKCCQIITTNVAYLLL
jgi:hypothetical protein